MKNSNDKPKRIGNVPPIVVLANMATAAGLPIWSIWEMPASEWILALKRPRGAVA